MKLLSSIYPHALTAHAAAAPPSHTTHSNNRQLRFHQFNAVQKKRKYLIVPLSRENHGLAAPAGGVIDPASLQQGPGIKYGQRISDPWTNLNSLAATGPTARYLPSPTGVAAWRQLPPVPCSWQATHHGWVREVHQSSSSPTCSADAHRTSSHHQEGVPAGLPGCCLLWEGGHGQSTRI